MSFIPSYPVGTQYAAIIDTNAYRDLCPGMSTPDITAIIGAFRAAEHAKGIVGVGLVIAAIELISGLVEGPGTKSYTECLSGIIAMAHHVHHDESNQPIIIPHPYLHIVRSFFNQTPPGMIDKVKKVGGVIFDFKKDVATALAWHDAEGTFQLVKSWLLAGEMEFADFIENLIKDAKAAVRKSYPKATEKAFGQKLAAYLLSDAFKNVVAGQTINAAGLTLGQILPPAEVSARAGSMIQNWPLAVGFTSWVCHTIHIRAIDIRSQESVDTRWNWAWDYQAAFLISKDTLNGRVPFIVTGDKAIRDVLRDYGMADRVMTLKEYKKRLGLP